MNSPIQVVSDRFLKFQISESNTKNNFPSIFTYIFIILIHFFRNGLILNEHVTIKVYLSKLKNFKRLLHKLKRKSKFINVNKAVIKFFLLFWQPIYITLSITMSFLHIDLC